MFISISVSSPLRKQLDSLKSRVQLPIRARMGIGHRWSFLVFVVCCVQTATEKKKTSVGLQFYMGVKLGLALREERKLRVFEDRVLRQTFGLRRK